KLVQESRNRKKNTDSSAGFHLKQLNLSVYFFSYWLVFAQPLFLDCFAIVLIVFKNSTKLCTTASKGVRII
ncbi:hypothetical protein ACTGXZ_10645, partial [Streptococcus suis]